MNMSMKSLGIGKSRAIGRTLLGAAMALMIGGSAAQAAEGIAPPSQDWSFNGVFGKFDKASAQRGLQVYTEVCASCHSLNLMYYRNITALGYTEDQAKAFAAQFEVTDGPNDDGDYFTRPARPSDRFAAPFENEKAAAASNGGKAPPDLSLMVKARMNGADYVYGLLTGYKDVPPAGSNIPEGAHYNEYFPGHQIAMAPPLSDGLVEYSDGTSASLEQAAKDITMFLAWTAEPEMEDRKGMGVKVFLFLLVFLGLAIANKKRLWAKLH